MATAYIAKIPEFTSEDNDTSLQEWLDKVQKAEDANEEPFENWQAFKDAFLQQFTNNNTSITLRNHFHNIKQETSETFIVELKDKLIKKIHPHASADLATTIRHVKNYEMAIEEVNHTKLVNLAIGETSLAAEEKIDQLTKKIKSYFTNQQQQQQQPQKYQPLQQHNQNNFGPPFNNQSQNCHYCRIPEHWKRNCRKLQRDQQNRILARRLVQYNQFTPQNQSQNNNNRINPNNQLVPQNSGQQRPNHYYTQPSYLTIPEESDFQQPALSEDEVAAPRSNSSNNTIPPAQIAQNTNLSDIFPFEFEANELPFLLSNIAANEQKPITAMYTKATIEGKPI
ncbi:hypothetical protein G9A89_020750 [Geosiphon pyriformis]|nr:hypothetical protein G9A89_020750 [Geosiphon pyriformis]